MINIIIDGNNLFHKTFGVFAGYGNLDPGKILKTKEEQGRFIRKVSTDLCSALNSLPKGGRLVFCVDSRSWRKDVEIKNGGYKSGRVRDEEVDWTIFFNLLHSFGEHLGKMGFVYSKVEGAEADDLMMYWSMKFMEIGENSIIISSDQDMHQLVRMNEDSWVCVWNNISKKNTLFAPIGWKSWLDKKKEITIFDTDDLMNSEKEEIKKFLTKVNFEEVDVKKFLMNKFLIGDDGDSVPTVWEYYKNDKLVRFTNKKAEQFLSLLESTEWNFFTINQLYSNEYFIEWASSIVMKISKDIDKKENREEAFSNIKRNFQLMWLDPTVIPEEINERCKSSIETGINTNRKNITLDRIKILNGTDWVTASDTPIEFDPFKNFLD